MCWNRWAEQKWFCNKRVACCFDPSPYPTNICARDTDVLSLIIFVLSWSQGFNWSPKNKVTNKKKAQAVWKMGCNPVNKNILINCDVYTLKCSKVHKWHTMQRWVGFKIQNHSRHLKCQTQGRSGPPRHFVAGKSKSCVNFHNAC